MSGSVILAFLGDYAATKVADGLLSAFRGPPLAKALQQAVERWIASLPNEHSHLHPDAIFRLSTYDPPGAARTRILEVLAAGQIPSADELENALVEEWTAKRSKDIGKLQPFFHLELDDARSHLRTLSIALKTELSRDPQLFQTDTHARLSGGLVNHHQDIQLAVEKLRTTDFMAGAKILAFKRGYHYHLLDEETRVSLLLALGDAHRRLSEFTQASEAYLEAYRLNPHLETTRVAEVRALTLQNRIGLAKTRLASHVISNPASVQLWKFNIAINFSDLTTLQTRELVPPDLQHDKDILLALGHHAHRLGDTSLAIEFLEEAISAGSQEIVVFNLLANSRLSKYRAAPAPSSLTTEDNRRQDLTRICEICDLGLGFSTGAPFEDSSRVSLLLSKADALVAMGDPERAAIVAMQAQSAFPNHPASKHAYAKLLMDTGNRAEAIRILREITPSVDGWQTQLRLAEILAHGDKHEQNEAVSIASSVCDNAASAADQVDSLHIAVETLIRLERPDDAEKLIGRAQNIPTHVASLHKARISLARGDTASALSICRPLAVETLPGQLTENDALSLIDTLCVCADFDLAAVVGNRLNPRILSKSDLAFLMRCMVRADADASVLLLADVFRENFGESDVLLATELVSLERSDPERAYAYMQDRLQRFPEDRLLRLRQSWLGVRCGRADWITSDARLLPSPSECDLEDGRVATRVLQVGGQTDEALRYAMCILRRNPESNAARDTFLQAIYGGAEEPSIPTPIEVDTDVAATLQDRFGRSRTVVIETDPLLRYPFEEVAPLSDLGAQLKGKKPGDTLTMPGPIEQNFTITRVEHKYLAWVREISSPLQTSENRLSVAEIHIPQEPDAIKNMARTMTAARRDSTHGIVSAYCQEDALPIHACANAMHESVFDLTFGLLSDEKGIIKADLRIPHSRIEIMRQNGPFIVDSTSIATLCFLGMLEHVAKSGIGPGVTPETLASIRRITMEARMHRPHLSLRMTGLHMTMTSQTKESLAQSRSFLEKAIALLDGDQFIRITELNIDRIPSSLRSDLGQSFGRGGLETIAAGLVPNATIITDDFAQAETIRALGGHAACSAALLSDLSARGLVSKDDEVASRASLLRSGYIGTSVISADLDRLFRLSDNSVKRAPFSHLVCCIANRDVPRPWREDLASRTIAWALRARIPELSRDVVLEDVVRSVEILGLMDDSLQRLLARVDVMIGTADRQVLVSFLSRRPKRDLRPN